MTEFRKGDKVRYTKEFLGHDEATKKLTGTIGTFSHYANLGGFAFVDYPEDVWPVRPQLLVENLELVVEFIPETDPVAEFQIEVFNYLRGHGSTNERREALVDLVKIGFFALGLTVEKQNEILNTYLTTNPRRFCDGGIRRFREALKLTPSVPHRSPLHKDAVRFEDLKEGDVLETHSPYAASKWVLTSTEKVEHVFTYSGNTAYKGKFLSLEGKGHEEMFLGDMGLEPYNGFWNETNYTIKVAI